MIFLKLIILIGLYFMFWSSSMSVVITALKSVSAKKIFFQHATKLTHSKNKRDFKASYKMRVPHVTFKKNTIYQSKHNKSYKLKLKK